MKEQIEEQAIMEMACDIRRIRESYFGQADYLFAKKLFEDGYRKQSEGVWIWTESGQEDYEQYWVCSCCHEKDYFEDKYCPNCGAKMKGGD